MAAVNSFGSQNNGPGSGRGLEKNEMVVFVGPAWSEMPRPRWLNTAFRPGIGEWPKSPPFFVDHL